MKKKKLFKMAIIFLTIFLLLIFIQSCVMADDLGLADDLSKYAQRSTTEPTKFVTKVNNILGVVQVIGSLCSVICLIVLGVKYMMGSLEEKAQYKKSLLPYFIGAIMVLGISNVLKIIYQIATNL